MLDDIKAEDVLVNADVGEAGKGNNRIALVVTAPSNVTVTKQSDKNVTVKVESLVKKKVALRATFKDNTDDNAEPQITETDVKEVEVRGAKSVVGAVDHANITLDAKKITDTERAFSVKAVPVDKRNKSIKYILCRPSKVGVKAVAGIKKKVKLNVRVNNPDSDNVDRTCKAPGEITIKGSAKAVAGIDRVDTKLIDISDIESTKEILLLYDLPEGVSIANESENLTLKVRCIPLTTKVFNISADDIKITGVGEGLSPSASGSVSVAARGSASELSSVDASSFDLRVDLSGKGAGTYVLEPYAGSSGGARRVAVNGQITVTLN